MMTDQQKIAKILERRAYFDAHLPLLEGYDVRQDISYQLSNTCPSCGYPTLDSRCHWDICTFCFWEDDGQDNHDADKVFGGPNGDYSLTSHRLEVFDWMQDLKDKPSDYKVLSDIGYKIDLLEKYIENNESDMGKIRTLVTVLSQLFAEMRGIPKQYVAKTSFW